MRRITVLGLVVASMLIACAGTASAGKIRLAQTSAVTTCMMTCNSQAANCQSNCVVPWQNNGSTTTANTATSANCQLTCSTQQIACQTTCARTSPSP